MTVGAPYLPRRWRRAAWFWVVATAAVHWPDMWSMWSELLKGYSISDRGYGNFKLPLLFTVMLNVQVPRGILI